MDKLQQDVEGNSNPKTPAQTSSGSDQNSWKGHTPPWPGGLSGIRYPTKKGKFLPLVLHTTEFQVY